MTVNHQLDTFKKSALLSVLIATLIGSGGCLTAYVLDSVRTEYTIERNKTITINDYKHLKEKYNQQGFLTAEEHYKFANLLSIIDKTALEFEGKQQDINQSYEQHLQAAAKLGYKKADREYNQLIVLKSIKRPDLVDIDENTQLIVNVTQFRTGLDGLLKNAEEFNPESEFIYQYFTLHYIHNTNIIRALREVLQAKDARLYPQLAKDIQLFIIFYDYYRQFKYHFSKPNAVYKFVELRDPIHPTFLESYYVLAKLVGDNESLLKIKQMINDNNQASLEDAESLYNEFLRRFQHQLTASKT